MLTRLRLAVPLISAVNSFPAFVGTVFPVKFAIALHAWVLSCKSIGLHSRPVIHNVVLGRLIAKIIFEVVQRCRPNGINPNHFTTTQAFSENVAVVVDINFAVVLQLFDVVNAFDPPSGFGTVAVKQDNVLFQNGYFVIVVH